MSTERTDTLFVLEPYPVAPFPAKEITRPRTVLFYAPPPPLAAFVELFWLCEGEALAHTKERVLPAGTLELVFDLREGENAPSVCGAQSGCCVVDTSDLTTVLGVHFRPGGAFPFLNLPAGELQDTDTPLDALWGGRAGRLQERLLEAATPVDRFRILERALLEQATQPPERHPAVAFALGEFLGGPRVPTVGAVAKRAGLSPKRFIRAFTEEVGLTPKLFCRIRRFQEALWRAGGTRRVEWARLALDCGYYDQAHLVREFQAFSGLSPTAYLRAWAEHLGHAPLAC